MKILVAEDNRFYRVALVAALNEWGYEVVEVGDGAAAWDILRGDDAPKLAVLDWEMPKLDGPAVCRLLRGEPRPEPTYVILLTSRTSKQDVVAGLHAGADDFVTKPFDRDELLARLRVGERIVGLQTGETVIYAFARAVDGKNPYTNGHSERVARYSLALGEKLGTPRDDLDRLRRGAILHDIGKIAVPDAILNKPGRLTPEEFAAMREHPVHGARMIEGLASVKDVLPLVRWHHERPDGRGYPDGLEGKDIPDLVRILSVADVYDALRSDRPYRDGMPHDACLSILREDAANGALDQGFVQAFCGLEPARFGLPAIARTI